MAKQNYTIVIIDDDPLVNSTVSSILSLKFSHVLSYTDATLALDDVGSVRPDLILLDIFLGHTNGLDVLERLREQGMTMPIIIMTAFSDIKMAVRAMRLGAEDFIVKPLDLEQLEVTVERALQNYNLRRQVNLLEERLQQDQPTLILGSSEGMKKAMQMAQLVAGAEGTKCLI